MISLHNNKNENLNKLNLKHINTINCNKFIKNISKSILINIPYYNWYKWKSIKWNNMKLFKNDNNNQLNNNKSIKSCSYNYFKIYFLLLLVLINFNKVLCEVCSSLPAVPVNAKLVEITRESDNVIAKYKCDSGYELLGNPTINCHPKKGWEIHQLPLCGVNIGFGKPVNQSSYTRTGLAYFSNDGKLGDQNPDKQECSETQKEISPWWQVDLLMAAEIKAVRIRTKSCCGSQQLQDLEIRVGNSSNDLQRNPLCAWYPGVLDEGITKTFLCARKLIGQYVFIQMVGIEGSLSLCEVEVFTNSELSTEKCIGSKSSVEALTATFSNTCYDFYLTKGKNFKEAENMCQLLGGNLIQELNYDKTTYVISLLERKKDELKTQLVWIGAEKEPGLTSRTWKWLNGKVILKPSWGKDQPNNYNGEQNCVVLDGGRNWLWNDVGCNLDYLHFICEYDPFSCGSPDIHQNTTVSGKDFSVGKSITYSCPTGFALLGSEKRTCTTKGLWNGTAPTCKYIDCGALSLIENGNFKINEDRTSYGAVGVYKCNDNFTLFGNPNRTCLLNGWSGDMPKCLSDLCADPPNINGGTVKINGKRAGATAEYSCDSGHVLVGEMVLKCELGGDWSSKPPTCRYVDCGQPPRPDRGNILFLSNATTIGSKVKYECDHDYWLIGNDETFCTDQGKWSGNSPICELISCDTPKVSPGSYVVGYDYNVHSSIEYKCDPGYILRGNPFLQCNANGEWDGEPPECEYVDCGKIKVIQNGKIEYLQNTTTIGSEVIITCSGTHRMLGNRKLLCLESGEWSDEIARCEEIRCPEPKLADHSILSITGNDRMYGRTLVKTANTSNSNTQTYKVGALAKYSCERGYKIIGDPLITCDNGKWSGTLPDCVFVDCGKPDEIPNGKIVLTTNATYLGTVVLYECDKNYKLNGISRRICINNGTWNGERPTCNKITCPDPDLKEMLVPISVSNDIDGVFKFKCVKGRTLMGNDTKVCLKNGEWSGKTPICKAIDCGKPSTIENGRVITVNDTTTYGATAEYHCVPNYHRSGQYLRKCLETGKWSGDEPKCELTITESSKGSNLGTGIAIGAAIILILLIIIALIFLQRNKVRPVKNTENIQAAERMEDRSAAVMSYSTLEGRNHGNHPSTLENLYDQIPSEQDYNSPYEMRINEEVYEPEPLKNAITINGITVR